MKTSTILLSSVLLATSAAALAAPAASNKHYQQNQGVYIGAQWLPAQEAVGNSGSDSEFHPAAAGINGGYQFNRYVALEAGLQGYFNHDSWKSGFGPKASESDSLLLPSLAVKGVLPVGSRISLYGKAGAALAVEHLSVNINIGIKGDGTASEFAPYLAVGVGIYASHHVEVTADQSFYYLAKSKVGIGMTGVGMAYHF